jgi:hypothetical protein
VADSSSHTTAFSTASATSWLHTLSMPVTSATHESSPRTITSTAAPIRISGTTSKTLFDTDRIVAATIRPRCGAA